LIDLVLNSESVSTALSSGTTVLDFVRYHEDLKGTKIGCREGDCGACTVLVGELVGDDVKYRTMTSCLMPLANAAGKHIVTIEGINPADGSLTPVQQAMVDENGTQCGFCTVGFVMSLTGFCIDDTPKTPEMAVSAVDGNICRCTGYKSIERAAHRLCERLSEPPASAGRHTHKDPAPCTPEYFADIPARLKELSTIERDSPTALRTAPTLVAGGTDLYVQRPEEMAETESRPLLYDEQLRGIRDLGDTIEIGGSATVTDLMVSPVMQAAFPNLYRHLKLVSSTPIRNMATVAGNFINASPIGDMTIWFLALDAEIELSDPPVSAGAQSRSMKLRDMYLGYKQLSKEPDEIITKIRFKKPAEGFRFNFEKVSKRTYLDIATVNTAISLHVGGRSVSDSHVSESPGEVPDDSSSTGAVIIDAHVSAGGVGPIPMYLKQTSQFLRGKRVNDDTLGGVNEIMQSEISPITDVRGTADYKRLLLRQLFRAHFAEVFGG
jgi:xanthine dehydrogenase small subunit